jgi:CHAT domain-containing protein
VKVVKGAWRGLQLLVVSAVVATLSGCELTGGGLRFDSPDRNAAALERAGKFREASVLRKQALDVALAKPGADADPAVADLLVRTATDYFYDAAPTMLFEHDVERGKALLVEANGFLLKAVAIYDKTVPADDVRMAAALRSLGQVTSFQEQDEQAQRYYERAIAIYEKHDGANAPVIADILADSERLYYAPAKHAQLERNLKRVLSIREQAFGADSPRTADALARLSYFYQTYAKRYDLAEPPARRELEIRERTEPNSRNTAEALVGLALAYAAQQRLDEAEGLYKRAVAIEEKIKGPDQVQVAIYLGALSDIYRSTGRLDEARQVLLKIQAIYEKRLGPDDLDVASTQQQLADIDIAQGKLTSAEPALLRARAIDEKQKFTDDYGLDMGFARLYIAQKKYRDAAAALAKARGPLEQKSDPLSPERMAFHNRLAQAFDGEQRLPEAMTESRQALRIAGERAVHLVGERSSGALGERRSWRANYIYNVDLADRLATRQPEQRARLTAESFEAGQSAQISGTEQAVANMAARFASSDDAMAKVIRTRQDAQQEWRNLDEALVAAARKPTDGRDLKAEAGMRKRLTDIDRQLDALDARLARDFPQYAEMADPKPAKLAAMQALLGPQEALLTYLIGEQRSFLWVVRRSGASLISLPIGQRELDEAVKHLRGQLDPTLSNAATVDDLPKFDVIASHALYRKILAGAESQLAGVDTLFVVADGPLQSLPFAILVTRPPAGPVKDFASYTTAAWLGRNYAITVLPAVSSMRALRAFARRTRASEPFTGYGDPDFQGNQARGASRGINTARLFRGGSVNADALRDLPRLPDTADELRAQATSLHAGPGSVHLGRDASVSAVKAADLADIRVIAFATHGLVAGDLPALAEPALALSPPDKPTPQDNGLLTASDVALLRLNADWVVLSACNTAAADGRTGAEGMSGLAKAFFYAGARSLLVSHWPVDSAAAVRLTTSAFAELEKDRSIGRAEALRRSMMALVEHPPADQAYMAHPTFWAPFVVVGEGGAGR